jgi:transcriptional regulator with XRE-family HTH domain
VKPEEVQEVIDHVARRIGELRTQVGVTQAHVAERLGMTLTNYQRVEHGLQNLTIKTTVRIANVLGVRTGEFFAPAKKPQRRRRGRPSR